MGRGKEKKTCQPWLQRRQSCHLLEGQSAFHPPSCCPVHFRKLCMAKTERSAGGEIHDESYACCHRACLVAATKSQVQNQAAALHVHVKELCQLFPTSAPLLPEVCLSIFCHWCQALIWDQCLRAGTERNSSLGICARIDARPCGLASDNPLDHHTCSFLHAHTRQKFYKMGRRGSESAQLFQLKSFPI